MMAQVVVEIRCVRYTITVTVIVPVHTACNTVLFAHFVVQETALFCSSGTGA